MNGCCCVICLGDWEMICLLFASQCSLSCDAMPHVCLPLPFPLHPPHLGMMLAGACLGWPLHLIWVMCYVMSVADMWLCALSCVVGYVLSKQHRINMFRRTLKLHWIPLTGNTATTTTYDGLKTTQTTSVNMSTKLESSRNSSSAQKNSIQCY